MRAARKHLRLTQQDLASRAGVSLGTITGFESGTSTPQRANLARILAVVELAPPHAEPVDPVVAAIEACDLDLWRRHALLAEYHRHVQEQATPPRRRVGENR